MRPSHEPTRHLVEMLTRSMNPSSSADAKVQQPKTAVRLAATRSHDVGADSLALFATRVQPILMNACVNCHSGGRGGNFQLMRGDAGQRGITEANMSAALGYIRMESPALSPLLIKAISRHGNAVAAPIKDRQAVPFKTMQAWIDYLLANNPQLRYEAENVAKAGAEPVTFAQAQVASTAPPARPMPRTDLVSVQAKQAAHPPSPQANEPIPNNLDAFDPAAFNHQR